RAWGGTRSRGPGAGPTSIDIHGRDVKPTADGSGGTGASLAHGPASDIQDEPGGPRPRAADHHRLVAGLLGRTEDEITVLRDALDHAHLAHAADAFLAGVVDPHARVDERIEDRPAGRHRDRHARA